jgi:hypothetical protein
MKELSTSETKSNDEIAGAFISVLNCTENEAKFYLELALYDIEKAVHFWLESDKSSLQSQQPYRRFKNDSSYAPDMNIYQKEPLPKYEHRNIIIADLPVDWSGWVNPHTGAVYFLHISGVVQYSVPPGYADAVNFEQKDSDYLEDSKKLCNVSLSLNSLAHNNFAHRGNISLSDDRDGSNESIRADCDSHTHTGFDDFDELKYSTKSSRSSPTDFQSNTEENYLLRDSDYIEELDDINQK